MIAVLSPKLLIWIPVLIAALFFLLKKDFVKMNKQEQAAQRKATKNIRAMMFLSRALIITCIITALAAPYTTKQILVQGDPSLAIFVDDSKSFDIFNRAVVDQVRSGVEEEIPVTVRHICEANRSAIGDALLSYLQGNDNVLLVSDGNNNYGRSLGDMLTFASMLNSTISALRLSPIEKDASVTLYGPSITTAQSENTFYAYVSTAGTLEQFELDIVIDGETVLGRQVSAGIYEFSKKFGEGYHKITARITIADAFPQNNVYYKTVKVEPKPKVAFISKQYSPMATLFSTVYELHEYSSLPGNLEPFSAVIISNMPAAELDAELLNSYVSAGNGLFVIGGEASFDMDNYKAGSYKTYEALLPVMVGQGGETEKRDVNVVLAIDKSGSTGSRFGSGSSNTVESVEKALALSILDDLRNEDQVAVVAFDAVSYVVSDFSRLGTKREELEEKISSLVFGGGTVINEGLGKAYELLGTVHGSKNVILISDGKSGADYWSDITSARTIAYHGGRVFTVGVGESTYAGLMMDLAEAGAGIYFEPEETQRIKVIFGKLAPKGLTYNLEIMNNYHFITSGLSLDAGVSGLNTVVPKSSAMMLVTTENNDPMLTVWRFGLGRVAVLSTDDGTRWSGPLLGEKNSLLLTRAANWAIGDLSRKKEFDVSMKDVDLGEVIDINVKSESLPALSPLTFSKTGEETYEASFYPLNTGFYSFFDADVAVNIEREMQATGLNPELESMVGLSGGKMFDASQVKEIIEKVRADSRRYRTEIVTYSWIPIVIALLVLLLEISIRRASENKKYK